MLDAAYFVGFKYRVSNAPPSVSLGELYLDANISENFDGITEESFKKVIKEYALFLLSQAEI